MISAGHADDELLALVSSRLFLYARVGIFRIKMRRDHAEGFGRFFPIQAELLEVKGSVT